MTANDMAEQRFERDLRAMLEDQAPADVPEALRAAVAGTARGRPQRVSQAGRRALAVLAVAAVVVLAIAAIAAALRLPGDQPRIGGPATPSPSVSGSLHLEYRVIPVDGARPRQADVDAVAAVMRARLDSTGVASSTITTEGADRIFVDVAVPAGDESVTGPIRMLLGTTGRLDFVPLGDTAMQSGEYVDLSKYPPLFSGDQVARATVGTNQNGDRTIDLTLRADGAALLAAYTAGHIGQAFAIVLDGTVVAAPIIKGAIPNGNVQVEQGAAVGGWPPGVAQQLVAILASGALPSPVQEVAGNAGAAEPTASP